MSVLYTNNAEAVLSTSITDSGMTLSVNTGQGALFPATTNGWYPLTLISANGADVEIVKVTSRSSDTFTIFRGQEGTTAKAFAPGTKVELRITKALLDQLKWDAVDERFGSLWGGNFMLLAQNDGVRIMGMPANSNTSLVIQGGAVSGNGPRLELTRGNIAYLAADSINLNNLGGTTTFLKASSVGVEILNGNLAVGGYVTQVPWGTGYKVLDLGTIGALSSVGQATTLSNNSWNDGTYWKSKTANPGAMYRQFSNTHSWSVMASVTANTQQIPTELMYLSGTSLDVSVPIKVSNNTVVHAGNVSGFLTGGLKTINGTSLVGSGDIVISGSGATSFFLGTTSVPFGRTSGTLAVTGLQLDASAINTGTVATARLGSGTANSSVFLRGDGSWQAVTASVGAATSTALGGVYGVTGAGANYPVAYGYGSGTGGYFNGTAIGGNSYAHEYGVAVGRGANASQNYAVAVGYSADANAVYGVAFGPNSDALGAYTVAIGSSASAQIDSGVAIGKGAYSAAQNSIAIGPGAVTSTSSAVNAISLGAGTYVGGQAHVVVGSACNTENASNNGVVAIGPGITVSHNTGDTVILQGDRVNSRTYTESGFFVDAVTESTADMILYYDTAKKKITYGAVPVSSSEGGGETTTTTATAIQVTDLQYYGGSSISVGFSSPDNANYVKNAVIAAGMAASNGYSTAVFDIVYQGSWYQVTGINDSVSAFIGGGGSSFSLNNLTIYSNGPTQLSPGVYLRFSQNIQMFTSQSPSAINWQTNGALTALSTTFATNKPFAVIIHPGDGQPQFGTQGPAGGTGTPAITDISFNGNSNAVAGTGFSTLMSLGSGSWSKQLLIQLGTTVTTTSAGGGGGGGGGGATSWAVATEELYFGSSYTNITPGTPVTGKKSLMLMFPMGNPGMVQANDPYWSLSSNAMPFLFLSNNPGEAQSTSFYTNMPGWAGTIFKFAAVGTPTQEMMMASQSYNASPSSNSVSFPSKNDMRMQAGFPNGIGAVYILSLYTVSSPDGPRYDSLSVNPAFASTVSTKSGDISLQGMAMKYKLFGIPASVFQDNNFTDVLSVVSGSSPLYGTYWVTGF